MTCACCTISSPAACGRRPVTSPTAATLQITVGTSETVCAGHLPQLTGALTSQGLEIRSAQIHTLADGLVLDRFWVHDPDYSGEPPPDRIEPIDRAVEQSLEQPGGQSTGLPPHLEVRRASAKMPGPKPQIRVKTDNSTSDRYTIFDVFAYDRTGLLYAVARTFFELGCSVWRAKISTLSRPGAGRVLRHRPGEPQDRGRVPPGSDPPAAAGGAPRRAGRVRLTRERGDLE